MKKCLALSSILSMLGALSVGTPQALAYRLDVVSNENILHHETLLDKLEKYEAQALAKLATALKDTKIDPDSMVTLALSLDGSIHGITYKDPGTAIQADSPARKALKEVRSMQFGKIPSLESGYIKMSLPFKELVDGNYKRKLYVVQTPEGQSIGGVGGVNIGKIIGNVPARPSEIEDHLKHIAARREGEGGPAPVAYSSKDRKFDNDIASIYSSITARPSSPAFDSHEKTNIKEIEEQTEKYLKQDYFLAAAKSYLNETKYFLRFSDLDKGKLRFEKAKNLIGKLQNTEKENLIKSVLETSKALARGNENFSCREYLLLEAFNMAKSSGMTNLDFKIDTIQALADFYMTAGQKANALTYYKQMLVETMKSKENPSRSAQTFMKIASAQMALNDKVAADKTLLEANRYLEKEAGKDSVILIPILVRMMLNATDEKTQEAKLERIESIVDKYKQAPVNDRRTSRDQDVSIAVSALMNSTQDLQFTRYLDPATHAKLILSASCARLGYKLKLKAEPRFDYFAFSQLTRAMQAAGQFEQTANLYKETLAMLERSTDRSTMHYADSIRRGYVAVLQKINKSAEADKLKEEIKEKENSRISEQIKTLEDRLKERTDQPPQEKVRLEVTLFGLYANQKNVSKTNEVLANMLTDLNAIDAPSNQLNSLGFTLIGPIRTQPEFFQADAKMEEMLIKTILLLDEKAKDGIDSMALNTLNLRIAGGAKNELARKVSKAIEESRNGRKLQPVIRTTGSLDEQINTASTNQDYLQLVKLRREKLDSMKSEKRSNQLLVTEALSLSRDYLQAKQIQESEQTFNEALSYADGVKPQELDRLRSMIKSSASFYMMNRQYEIADKALRKCADLTALMPDSDDGRFFRFGHELSSISRAYIQNGDFDKAMDFERYILNKLESSQTPNKKLIYQARLELSLTLLQIANRDPKRKDTLMQESDKEFNKALSELTSYYGPKSAHVKQAVTQRMSEVKPDDLQALETLKKLQQD